MIPMLTFRINGNMFMFFMQDLERIMNPRRVKVVPVNGDATCMSQEESEPPLFKAILGRQRMDVILLHGSIQEWSVKVAGMVGDDDRGLGKDFGTPLRCHIAYLGP